MNSFDDFLLDAAPAASGLPLIENMQVYGGESHICGPQLYLFRAVANPNAEGDVSFYFRRFRAVRFTPCGAWVTEDPDYYPDPELHWVDTQYRAGKRLAHLTKEDAMYSLKRRNARHVQILASQWARAKDVFAVLNTKVPA